MTYFYILLSCEVKQESQPLKQGLKGRRKKIKGTVWRSRSLVFWQHMEPTLIPVHGFQRDP